MVEDIIALAQLELSMQSKRKEIQTAHHSLHFEDEDKNLMKMWNHKDKCVIFDFWWISAHHPLISRLMSGYPCVYILDWHTACSTSIIFPLYILTILCAYLFIVTGWTYQSLWDFYVKKTCLYFWLWKWLADLQLDWYKSFILYVHKCWFMTYNSNTVESILSFAFLFYTVTTILQ